MTVLRRFLEQRATIENPSYPLTSQALIDLFTRRVAAGVSVNEFDAMRMTAVYRCVSLISGMCAGLPIKTYRGKEPDRVEVDTPILSNPYPDVTPFCFWEQVYVDLLLWGNAFLYKVRSELGGQWDIVKLLRIPPWTVGVTQDESTPLNPGGKRYKIGDSSDRFTTYEVMHITALGIDGLAGLSRIGLGKEAIGVALAAEQTAAKLFGDGLVFAGVLSTDQDLTADQARGLGAMFREALLGHVSAGSGGPGPKIPVLGRGTTFDKMSMSAEEAQYTQSRGYQVEEIGRLFGVPLPLLMVQGHTSNYGTGLEQQMLYLLQTTLDPQWLRRVEQAITLHLTPRGQFAEYTRAALLRTDTLARYQAYAVGIQWGFLSRADVRRLENLAVDDPTLEEFLVPVNMGASSVLDLAADAAQQADPADAPAPDPTTPAPDPQGAIA